MEIIYNIEDNREYIEPSIKKYAYSPEHTFHYLKYYKAEEGESCYAYFKDKSGIMLIDYEDEFWMVNEPLGPKENHVDMFMQVMDHVFKNKEVKKITVEFGDELRKKVIKKINEGGVYYARRTTDMLTWPIFNMKTWDDTLPGKKWKKIRNYLNKFKRENTIEFKTAQDFTKEELKALVKTWVKGRTPNDRAFDTLFYNYIEGNFEGFDMTRAIVVNGKLAALTGGWKILNSNNYYSSVGIYDYSFERIGELANVDDLIELKKKGYDYIDFGGGGADLTKFKNKFLPESSYRTHIFAIARLADKKTKKKEDTISETEKKTD